MRHLGVVVALAAALVLAGIATLLVTGYLRAQTKLAQAGPPVTPVVVSAADLSFGQILRPQDLKVALYPQESLPKGAVAVVDSLVGQITKVFLAQNEPVLVSKLSSIGGGLSLLLAPNMRAISLPVNLVSGVSGFVLPGDRVDVIAVVEGRSATIMQNIEVIAAGMATEQKGTEPMTVQTVTLVVDKAGAETLALATAEGRISLALRNPTDNRIVTDARAMTMAELIRSRQAVAPPEPPAARNRPARREEPASVPAPAPAPPAVQVVAPAPRPETLTIIRGTDKTKEQPAMEAPGPGSTEAKGDARGRN